MKDLFSPEPYEPDTFVTEPSVPNYYGIKVNENNCGMLVCESPKEHFTLKFVDEESNKTDSITIAGWNLSLSKENPNVVLYSKGDLLFSINMDFQSYLDAQHYVDVMMDYLFRIEKCTTQEELDAIKVAELEKRQLDKYHEMIVRMKLSRRANLNQKPLLS